TLPVATIAAAGIGQPREHALRLCLVDGAGEVAPSQHQPVELDEIAGWELAECRSDEIALRRHAGLRQAPALRRQVHGVGAPVSGDGAALDQPRLDQPVDQARNIALGDVEPLGELALADAFALGQGREQVELRDGETELADARRHLAEHTLVQPHEAEPDAVWFDRLRRRNWAGCWQWLFPPDGSSLN